MAQCVNFRVRRLLCVAHRLQCNNCLRSRVYPSISQNSVFRYSTEELRFAIPLVQVMQSGYRCINASIRYLLLFQTLYMEQDGIDLGTTARTSFAYNPLLLPPG